MSTSLIVISRISRLGILCCALTFFGLHVEAQDYGVVDTIRISDQRQYVQAYHDTVMIFEQSPVGGVYQGTGFTRFGKTAQWDSVTLYSEVSLQPPLKGCVFAGHRPSSGDVPASYWILRDARMARIVPVGRPGDQITTGNVDRIRVHPANTRKIYAQTEYKVSGGYVTNTFVTNDDGETWKEIQTPVLPNDAARKQWLSFDYTYPDRLYITVDPSARSNPDANPRTYFTDDDGDTFRSAVLSDVFLVVGLGIWSKTGGVYGSEDVISFYTDSIGLPPDSIGTRVRIEPPWLENVRKSLFPKYDSTKQKLGYSMSDNRESNGTIEGLAFHPERPLMFAANLYIDTLVDGKWYNRGFVVATRDFGDTWSFIVPPSTTLGGFYQKTTSLAIDPFEDAVYASVLKRQVDPQTSKETILGSFTIKSSPRTTSVNRESPRSTIGNMQVFPNPVFQGSAVSISISGEAGTGANITSSVSCRTLDGRLLDVNIESSDGSGDYSTSHFIFYTSEFTPGVYIVQVQTNNRTQSRLLVVTH